VITTAASAGCGSFRDPLVLTGKPWNRTAARFAAPILIISPLPLISCPVRAANADAVEIVRVRQRHQGDPQRPEDQDAADDEREHRRERDGARGVPSTPASGKIVAAIIGPSEEPGPSTRILDGPKTA